MKLEDPEREPRFWLVTNNVVLNTPFPGIQIKALSHDPEREPRFWLVTNNVVLNTPFPGIQIKALSIRDRPQRPQIGVFYRVRVLPTS
jgi:hypothetical protein